MFYGYLQNYEKIEGQSQFHILISLSEKSKLDCSMELVDPSFSCSFNPFTTVAVVWWHEVYNDLRKSLYILNDKILKDCKNAWLINECSSYNPTTT